MMSAGWVLLGLVVVAGLLCVVLAGWWRGTFTMLSARTLDDAQLDELGHIAERLKLHGYTERHVFGARVLSWWGERDGFEVSVELCDSEHAPYVRLESRFATPLEQGLQMIGEEESGAVGWLMRFQEVEVGYERVDAEFIVLTKDEARLHELMELGMGTILVRVQSHDHVSHVTLTDSAFFIFCPCALDVAQLTSMIKRLDRVSSWILAQVTELGPSHVMTSPSYEEAFGQLFNRDEHEGGEESEREPVHLPYDPNAADPFISELAVWDEISSTREEDAEVSEGDVEEGDVEEGDVEAGDVEAARAKAARAERAEEDARAARAARELQAREEREEGKMQDDEADAGSEASGGHTEVIMTSD